MRRGSRVFKGQWKKVTSSCLLAVKTLLGSRLTPSIGSIGVCGAEAVGSKDTASDSSRPRLAPLSQHVYQLRRRFLAEHNKKGVFKLPASVAVCFSMVRPAPTGWCPRPRGDGRNVHPAWEAAHPAHHTSSPRSESRRRNSAVCVHCNVQPCHASSTAASSVMPARGASQRECARMSAATQIWSESRSTALSTCSHLQ